MSGRPQPIVGGDETVLLVDDEPGVRQMTASILTHCGYRVLIAEDAEQALAVLEQHEAPVHLLLTDVAMPAMSGPELYRLASGRRPSLKVLFISGYPQDLLERHEALCGQEVEMLQKPYGVADLAQKIREVLDRTPPD